MPVFVVRSIFVVIGLSVGGAQAQYYNIPPTNYRSNSYYYHNYVPPQTYYYVPGTQPYARQRVIVAPQPPAHGYNYQYAHPQAMPHSGFYGQSYGYPTPRPRRGVSQFEACARIENPISRQACECSVQFGGVAWVTGGNGVDWHDPRGGGGNLALQACKTTGHAPYSRQLVREIEQPGGVR